MTANRKNYFIFKLQQVIEYMDLKINRRRTLVINVEKKGGNNWQIAEKNIFKLQERSCINGLENK